MNKTNHREFWAKHPGLIWSNRNAPDDAFIAAALRAGRFLQLLDIAVEFGLERMWSVWNVLKAEGELSRHCIDHTEQALSLLDRAHERATTPRDEETVESD